MLSIQFREYLEYHLTATLSKSSDIDRRRCWCDGILPPEFESLETSGQIFTRAWIDEGRVKGQERGQHIYEMTINLGDQAFKSYVGGDDLIGSLPTSDSDDWIRLDRELKQIELQLL